MKKYFVALCMIISVAIIYFIFSFKFYDDPNNLKAIEFSQEIWNQYPEKRYTMVDDLLANYDFSNMSKKDVINLLGEKSLDSEGNIMRYETKGGFFEDEVLQFIFDENGKFVSLGIAN